MRKLNFYNFKCVIALLVGLSNLACDSTTIGPVVIGCSKDTDCKGERICELATGTCVDQVVMVRGCEVDTDCKGERICDAVTKRCVDPLPPALDAAVQPESDSGIHPDAEVMMFKDAMVAPDASDAGTSTGAADAGTSEPFDAGVLPKGDCCDANITAGCMEASVEACVCAQRPSCCTTVWDAVCVDLVRSAMCGTCPGTCGDGFCDPATEDLLNCCLDCGADPSDPTGMTPQLGDRRCCAELGENQCNSPMDCGSDWALSDPNGPLLDSFCGDGICCPATGEAVCDGTAGCRDCHADPVDPANDGKCCLAAGENSCNAPGSNCPVSVVGDGVCSCDETCRNAPADCGNCGDCCTETTGIPGCSDQSIEACVCAMDPHCCQSYWDSYCIAQVRMFGCGACPQCGDAICDPPPDQTLPATDRAGGNFGEDSINCCEDCTSMGTVLGTGLPGDGACNCGESACSVNSMVVTDCGPPPLGMSCGNGGCETCAPWNEATTNCPDDCGTLCGDGVCNGMETRCNCSTDCPRPGQMTATPINPADGFCECTENCATAPSDCGECPACPVMGAPQVGRIPPIDASGFVNAGPQEFEIFPGLPAEQEPGCMPAAAVSSHEIVFVIHNNSGMSRSLTAQTQQLGLMTDPVIEARRVCDDVGTALACSADIGHLNFNSRITFNQGTAPIYLLVDSQGAGGLGTLQLVITQN